MNIEKKIVDVDDVLTCKYDIYTFESIFFKESFFKRLKLMMFSKPIFKKGQKYKVESIYTSIVSSIWFPAYDPNIHDFYYHKYFINGQIFSNGLIEKVFYTPSEIRKNKLDKLNKL